MMRRSMLAMAMLMALMAEATAQDAATRPPHDVSTPRGQQAVTDTSQRCPSPLAPRTQVELYFGRNIGETLGVDADAWARFLDEEITPRFPDGLSVIDIDGQWKDRASGRIVREPGKLVVLIVDSLESARERLAAIIERYKVRHRQQSVLMTSRDICTAD